MQISGKFYGIIKIGRTITLARFRNTYNTPLLDYFAANGVSRELFLKSHKKTDKIFHERHEILVLKARTRSGVKKTLIWLEKNGIRGIIFSNHTIPGIRKQTIRLRIDKYFDAVLARNDEHGTPHERRNKGYKLEQYLEKNKYRKSEVLAVGDSLEEIDIVRTLGLKVAAITGGYFVPQLVCGPLGWIF